MKPLRTLVIATLVVGISYAGWRLTRSDPKPVAQTPPVPVTVASAKSGEMPEYLSTIGNVRALNSVEIRPQVGGVLIEVPVKEGDEVQKGQVLALIDPRPLKAALERAQAQLTQDTAQLANAQLDQKRYSALASRDFASRQQLDTQNASVTRLGGVLAADQAAITEASVNLSFSVLTAPFDGQIGIRRVDPGNLLQANSSQAILTVVQERPTSVIFNLPESELPIVRDATRTSPPTVLASTPDDGRILARGVLQTIDNAVDSNSGTIQMRATFANQDRMLTAGQFVNVRIQVDTARGVLVPHTAVQHSQQGLFVFTIDPNQDVRRQEVTVGYDDGSQAVITRGLSAGATVVTAGQTRIGEGTRVSFKDETLPQQAAER